MKPTAVRQLYLQLLLQFGILTHAAAVGVGYVEIVERRLCADIARLACHLRLVDCACVRAGPVGRLHRN